VVLSSKSPHKLIPTIPNFNQYDIYIINYDVLWYWVKALSQIPFKIVIYDESHYLKNYKSRRTGAAYQLAWIKSKLFMSGTLATNRPEELFVPLNLLEPREFYNWTYYANRYCGANSYNGWLTRGATHVNELHHRIQPLLLRRKKEDVLKDLPPKLYSVVPIEIENRAEYRKAELQFVDWLVNRHGASKARSAMIAEALTKLTYLKSLVAEGVLKPTIQWISDFLTSTERKLVVFGIHTTLVTGIYEHFRDIAVMIDGSISTEKRMPIVDQFQNNPKVRLFVGNIQAAGVGITLTAASDVMVCEFPWTPGVLDQCLDRLHRIGQKNQVMVYYLAARQTIEEKVVSALSEKRKVLAKLLDGKPVEKQQQNVIDYLISQYEK
jgi:SWI/SNF-related matrix-associated actin-dependent regulator 1 of chromatin subfamily A